MQAKNRKHTMYEPRTYRNLVRTDDLVNFEVIVKETDLLVRAKRDLSRETRESVLKYRHQLETYISTHPEFHRSLIPLEEDPFAPEIAQDMIRASQRASVGPMAAVAGAVAAIRLQGPPAPFRRTDRREWRRPLSRNIEGAHHWNLRREFPSKPKDRDYGGS